MEKYFREALNNFIFEEAGGGAVRHLADRGYTAKQITESLSFPIPYEKVREAFTKHLLESGILLRESPAAGIQQEKTEFVKEYDKYGKASFRKVTVPGQGEQQNRAGLKWEELSFDKFLLLYRGKAEGIRAAETEEERVQKNVYISCSFGTAQSEEMLQVLEPAQQEYIRGICWTRREMYHLLDKRMLGIAVRLRERELPAGKVYIRH